MDKTDVCVCHNQMQQSIPHGNRSNGFVGRTQTQTPHTERGAHIHHHLYAHFKHCAYCVVMIMMMMLSSVVYCPEITYL